MAPPMQNSKNKSRSSRSGLTFPVGRIHKMLRMGKFASRVGGGAAIYMAATLEYLAAEVLELAASAAEDNNRKRMDPRHILLAVRHDDELGRMLNGVTFMSSGVIPSIQPELLPKKTAKSKKNE